MDTVFPPSPQWHQPHSACLVSQSENSGWLVYSHNNTIQVLNPFSLKHQGVLRGSHTAKINALAARPQRWSSAFAAAATDGACGVEEGLTSSSSSLYSSPASSGPLSGTESALSSDLDLLRSTLDNAANSSVATTGHNYGPLVASVGDDMRVVCWNLDTRRAIASIFKVHSKVIKAVEWTGDGQLIVSGDKGGVIVVWDPFQEKKTLKFELPTKPSISCMSSSPTHPDVIAIGMDGGDIFVCKANLSGVFVQQRLHGHTERIHSLAWQPSQFQGQDYTSLASGSGDQTVRVWDVVSEISSVVMKVPDLDDKLPQSQKVKFWVPVGWVTQGQRLMSATSRGKMVVWDMSRKNSSGYSKLIDGKLHDRQVYQIMVWPSGSFAFTTSMDRRIIAWDVDNGQGLAQIECIGGNIYALDIGTVDPGRIAISLGNETLKIWNTLSREEPYECITIDRLNTRARAVRWHPAEEGTLCFGLESGKIGMLTQVHGSFSADNKNVNNGNGAANRKGRKKGRHDKQAAHASSGPIQTIFHSYHEKSVTSMAWCSSKVFEAPVPELFDLALADGTFCLMSCGGEGKILVSDASKPSSKSLDLDMVIQRQNAAWYESYREIKGAGQPERRDFAIHPNEDLLALGNADGSVEVFELKYFKLVYVYQSHRSRVNRVCWSESGSRSGGQAGAGGEDGSGVMDLYLLASGSDEGVVAIHNLKRFSGSALAEKRASRKKASSGSSQDPLDDSIMTSPTAVGTDTDVVLPTSQVLSSFQYHSKGISDLAWSPHGPTDSVESVTRYHRIVTASYDGKAVVVEVRLEGSSAEPIQDIPQDGAGENAEERSGSGASTPVLSARKYRAIASYTDHEDQVLSVAWSLTETDRVYSGGNDWGLCSWDVKSHLLTEAQSLALVRGGGGLRKHPKTTDAGKGSTKPQPATTASTASSVVSVEETSSQSQLPRTTSVAQTDGEDVSIRGENLQADQTLLAPEDKHAIAVEPFASKRTRGSSPHPESTPTKRSRTTSNNPVAITTTTTTATPRANEPPTSTITTSTSISTHIQKLSTPTKRLQLFPMGTAAFHGQSTQKTHLEILRLTRNLYCRRIRQGGVLRTEEELEAARGRWRAMRAFFEEDGEDEGEALSVALGQDVDEMNLEDDDTSLSGQHTASGTRQLTAAADDASTSSGDLIFYGSRESVKALAEMEADEMAQTQPQNIFVIGSGMGVMPPASSSLKDSIVQTKNGTRPRAAGQLCQVPISCWLGDVPKVLDIVSALGPSEVGVQDWIAIALSPMGGVEAWKGMMVKTAGKFEARGEVHAAGLCYLSVGMIFEAVDVYRKQGLFREALTLLRIRLWDHYDDDDMEEGGEDDTDVEVQNENQDETSPATTITTLPVKANKKDLRQLHLRILTEWGQQLEKRNQYEQACKCQLTLGSLLKTRGVSTKKVTAVDSETKIPSVGLQTLARRGDVATLRTVAGLAILMDDPTVQESVARYRSALLLKKEARYNRRSQV